MEPRRSRPSWIGAFGPPAAIVAVQQVLFPSFDGDTYLWGLVLQGATLGSLSALVAVGMALIHRANRVLNLAQGDLGLVPVTLAVDLILFSGWSYVLGLVAGLALAAVLGAAVELAVIRRFLHAPRLILTVATIGVAQLLAFGALALPWIWGKSPLHSRIDAPFGWEHEVAPFVFDADHVVAWMVAPLLLLAVAGFLRFTDVGVAVRAAADRADRAALLGVPVGRLHTCVWVMATVLSFLALFLRAGLTGLPLAAPVGLSVLLTALAALLLGRLTNLPAIAISAVAVGLLETHVGWHDGLVAGPIQLDLGGDVAFAPVLAVVIVAALGLQRTGVTRAERDLTSSWRASDEVRPIPRELRGITEVRVVRSAGLGLVAALLVALPYLPWLGRPGNTLKAGAVLLFAVIGLSISILTGWAGQVSLGHMGFVAIGAALGAKATTAWGLDLTLAVPLTGVVGAAAGVVVGLPALRLRGIHHAVTTLAFGLATVNYVVNPQVFGWVPTSGFEPRPLLGTWDYGATTEGTYQLCLGTFVVCALAVGGIRTSRTGRVLVAVRDNERTAEAYGVSAARAKLTAFALSGFFAAVAGAVLVHHNGQFTLGLFPPQENLVVFTAAVVGGLGSTAGALLGAVFLKGGQWFLQHEWRLLASAIGVTLVLLVVPGGLGGACHRGRDLWLRWVARRRGVRVPSLLADRAPADSAAPDERAARPLEPMGAG